MHPAFSVILFTTIAGAAQGLVVVLALLSLTGAPVAPGLLSGGLLLAFVMLVIGLIASFFHLGRPERAWRAATMWRTSWLSREVIVLPAFIACVALWWLLQRAGTEGALLTLVMLAALVLAGLLWWCTAMIYACIRFIQEWAHPLTIVNYTLIGLACGVVLAAAAANLAGDAALAIRLAGWGLGVTALAAVTRLVSLWRNATLKPKSTLQSATGIQGRNIRQTSMGMTAGAFNTREFFNGASPALLRMIKPGFLLTAFALPALGLWLVLVGEVSGLLPVIVVVQLLGVLAERWFFFAQARHPQNLYYQTVS